MKLSNLDNLTNFPHADVIFSALSALGGENRFIGGCVRDTLLERNFVDIDIATTLLPEQIQLALTKKRIKNLPLGIEHGTITAIIYNHQYEITSLREDVSTDGRRAVVKFTNDWKKDAHRRDFTINAMSYCPVQNKLYDYFTGLKDLKHGIIKFIGDPTQRILEDHLRILRYFRFLAYYGDSQLDQSSLDACQNNITKIHNLSGERKSKELFKILQAQNSLKTLNLMYEVNVLQALINEIRPNFSKVLQALSDIEKLLGYDLNYLIKLFALIKDTPQTINILSQEFKLSNKQKTYLLNLQKISSLFDEYPILNLAYKYGKDQVVDSLIFYLANKNEINNTAYSSITELQSQTFPPLPITGQNIIEKLNVKPGPIIKKLLQRAEDHWVSSNFSSTSEELINYLKQYSK
jgi:poly(A) polymerase